MTKYIDRYYLNGTEYKIKFAELGWQPGVNTLVYCELNGNITNTASTGYSMTNGGNTITYSTVGNIQVGYFNGGNIYTSVNSASELNDSLTYNIRIKNGTNYVKGYYIVTIGDQAYYKFRTLQSESSNNYRISGWYSDLDTASNTLVTDVWQNVVATINPTTGARSIYINGVEVANDTGTFDGFSNENITIGGDGGHSSAGSVTDTYLSKVIIENKERTAQEISDYFNQTKSLYGIS